MNIEQAESKLAEIKRSTGTKHVKTLVSELCDIVGFLLGEIGRIKDSPTVPFSVNNDFRPPHIDPLVPCQPPWPDNPKDVPIRKLPPVTIVKTNTDGGIKDVTDMTNKDSE